MKPRPYGTLQAVGIICTSTSTLSLFLSLSIIHDHRQTFPFLSLEIIWNAMPSFFCNLLLDWSLKMGITCWSSCFIIQLHPIYLLEWQITIFDKWNMNWLMTLLDGHANHFTMQICFRTFWCFIVYMHAHIQTLHLYLSSYTISCAPEYIRLLIYCHSVKMMRLLTSTKRIPLDEVLGKTQGSPPFIKSTQTDMPAHTLGHSIIFIIEERFCLWCVRAFNVLKIFLWKCKYRLTSV